MSNTDYEKRYCLFIDILGFKEHVDESVKLNHPSKPHMTFPKLKAALTNISSVHYVDSVQISGELRSTSRQVTQFSDSVVVSYLKDEPLGLGVGAILMDVHRLQLDLAAKGILLRGAVTSGLLHHDQSHVFGPALNEAVALEKLANYPRVILDREILDEAGLKYSSSPEATRTTGSKVVGDFDGLYYVDYFNVHPDDFDGKWDELFSYLERLREVIKNLSLKRDPSVKVKHSWLRTKFNLMASLLQKGKYTVLGAHRIPDGHIKKFESIKPF